MLIGNWEFLWGTRIRNQKENKSIIKQTYGKIKIEIHLLRNLPTLPLENAFAANHLNTQRCRERKRRCKNKTMGAGLRLACYSSSQIRPSHRSGLESDRIIQTQWGGRSDFDRNFDGWG